MIYLLATNQFFRAEGTGLPGWGNPSIIRTMLGQVERKYAILTMSTSSFDLKSATNTNQKHDRKQSAVYLHCRWILPGHQQIADILCVQKSSGFLCRNILYALAVFSYAHLCKAMFLNIMRPGSPCLNDYSILFNQLKV